MPFDKSAEFFNGFSNYLIIEFPKREDSWVQRLLNSKGEFKDHFGFYNLENFINVYSKIFELVEQKDIVNSNRALLLFKKNL